MSILWKLWAFLKRDAGIDLSYRMSFLLEAAHAAMAVAAFYFFSRLLGDQRPEGYDSFAFILVGMSANAYMATCLVCFSQTIRDGQMAGTLKAILATPTSPMAFLVYSSTYPFMRASWDAAIYTMAGMAFGLSTSRMNFLSAGSVLFLSLLAFSGIGIISATFTLVFKRGDPLLWLFGSASWLLGGVLFPTSLLPPVLQHIAVLLPITHAVNGMRAALLTGASLRSISSDLSALAIFGAIAFPTSLLVFSRGVEHIKRVGSLAHR